jgi:phosphate transport system substrate-binding protein
LYALGMTCICLLTNKKSPFDLDLPEDREQWKETASISPKLTQVLSKMIELNPGDRYRTAADIRQALTLPTTLLNGFERDKSLKSSFKYWIKKNPIASSIITGISVVSIVFFGHFFYKIHSAKTNFVPLIPSITKQTDNIADVEDVPLARPEPFKYGGSTTWSGLIKHINVKSFFPHFKLKYVEAKGGKSNSESGVSMLINGELDFALSSNKLDDLIEKAAQNNIKLAYIPVAISGFSIAVNPKLNVSGLTTGQYDSIIKGSIKTWNEIDKGVDTKKLKIRIYATDKKYLDGAEFIPVQKSEEAFQKVAEDPGGLHISATALVVGQCRVKGLPIRLESSSLVSPYKKYFPPEECSSQRHSVVEPKYLKHAPFSRNLYVVVVQDGGEKEQAGMAYAKIWLTNQGQEIVADKGYQKISK